MTRLDERGKRSLDTAQVLDALTHDGKLADSDALRVSAVLTMFQCEQIRNFVEIESERLRIPDETQAASVGFLVTASATC
ncbi:MAG: hypothetical protein BGP23_15905 [Lysobacterales bacterium 66-474]|nr:MAG: hypothetical protein ABT17_11440 [Rhodanobacter sp. SCN 69-32]OJY84059.1 MAG: hypothetical protein BGP23_15905 [Xanthomonadales bacterium 66-474]